MRSVESWFEAVRRLAKEHRETNWYEHDMLGSLVRREMLLEQMATGFGLRVRLTWDDKEQAYKIVGLLG